MTGRDDLRLLTSGEVAALLHVHIRTVDAWADRGKFDFIRTPGGHRRFPRAQFRDVIAYLNNEPSPADTAMAELVEYFGGSPVAALLALADRYEIAVAYLDRDYFAEHLRRRGHVLTDEEWKRIAGELADSCSVIDDTCPDQIEDHVAAVLTSATVGA